MNTMNTARTTARATSTVTAKAIQVVLQLTDDGARRLAMSILRRPGLGRSVTPKGFDRKALFESRVLIGPGCGLQFNPSKLDYDWVCKADLSDLAFVALEVDGARIVVNLERSSIHMVGIREVLHDLLWIDEIHVMEVIYYGHESSRFPPPAWNEIG